jgi:hypothetical protein
MAKIWFRSNGISTAPRELNWGTTRLGRAEDNDLRLDHPSISSHHCQIELGLDFVLIRDLGSTNGTFIDGQRVAEARLEPGQALRLGDVEVLVERSLAQITVPEPEPPKLPQSVVLGDGSESCLNHPAVRAAWRCTYCRNIFCNPCIHHLHIKGGRRHKFCPHCHNEVELIVWDEGRGKKKSIWSQIKGVFGGDGGDKT